MIKLDKTEHEKIHTRWIDVTTYDGGSDAIIVEGKLKECESPRVLPQRSKIWSVVPKDAHIA